MGDVVFVGWIGRGCERPVGGGCDFASDTRFTMSRGVEIRSPRACCMVSSLESILLRSRRLQLTRVGSPARYQLFTPGYGL